jgi:hypothetical protein
MIIPSRMGWEGQRMITLKWILKRNNAIVWTGFNWLIVLSSGDTLNKVKNI